MSNTTKLESQNDLLVLFKKGIMEDLDETIPFLDTLKVKKGDKLEKVELPKEDIKIEGQDDISWIFGKPQNPIK